MNINIKQMRKDVRKNIYDNKFSFYIKAVFLQLILSSIGSFLIRFVFQLILISSGLENLNIDNFFELFDNPLSIALLIILFLLISALTFIEFSALTLMVYFSYNDGFFSWSKNIRTSDKTAFFLHHIFHTDDTSIKFRLKLDIFWKTKHTRLYHRRNIKD